MHFSTGVNEHPIETTEMPVTTSKSIGPITWDDATWILTSSFIIFTMQSGRKLFIIKNKIEVLQFKCVSERANEANEV